MKVIMLEKRVPGYGWNDFDWVPEGIYTTEEKVLKRVDQLNLKNHEYETTEFELDFEDD